MNSTPEKIKSQGKASIIESAFMIINDRRLSVEIVPSDYDITVWANTEKLLVKFRRKLKYVPFDSHYIYDLSVDMLTKEVSPFDDWYHSEKDSFYIPSEEDKANIEFVKKHCEVPIDHFENYVYEHFDSYQISITNKHAFRKFELNKLTGEQSLEMEGSYMAEPRASTRLIKDPLKEFFD